MKSIPSLGAIVLALLALSLVAGSADAAPGVSLRWNHCLSDGGVLNKTFACNTNSGSHTLVGTFRLATPMNDVIGAEIVLQLASASAVLPSWWQFLNLGSCRQSSLLVNNSANPADLSCLDWSSGQMFVGIASYCTSAGPCADRPSTANAARIKLVEAVAQEFATPLAGGQDYFAFNLVVQNANTVGSGACSGCETPVCIVLNSIDVVAKGNVEHRTLSGPTNGTDADFAAWQGGGTPVVGGLIGCPAATPARNSTWGALKSLYR
jgi:hypothetical protein